MRPRYLTLACAAVLAFFATLCFAQAAPPVAQAPATAPPPHRNIAQRKENQQDRIAQGVRSGQLTAGETSRLEGREAHINREERNMRAQDHGHLTAADRARVNRQQSRTSQAIYRDKHNAARQ